MDLDSLNTMESPLVQLQSLHFSRNSRAILHGVKLTIPKGKVTAIMGPSGSGKTTLLRLIGGQLQPDSGRVLFEDTQVNGLPRKQLYGLRQRMGMLFQSGALFTHLSVFDNVAFPLRAHTKLSEKIIHTVVLMKLEAVGLRGAEKLMPSELSGGMSRRVALARAIALDPELILYDEPFAGQDPITMGVLMKLIRNLNDALGITSVLVSHDVTETAHIADHLYVIAGAKVIGQGTPEQVLQDDTPELKQFMHGLPDGVVPFRYSATSWEDTLKEIGGGQ